MAARESQSVVKVSKARAEQLLGAINGKGGEDLDSALAKEKARFEQAGQGQVFDFLGRLSDEEKNSLLEQCRGIDLERVERLFKATMAADAKGGAM